jgi:serine protease Do
MRQILNFSRSHKLIRILGVISFIGFLGACQTTGEYDLSDSSDTDASAKADGTISESYSIFFDQGDHLKRLMKDENFKDSAKLYEEQKTWFDKPGNRKKFQEILVSLSTHFNSPISALTNKNIAALSALSFPQKTDAWENVKKLLVESRSLVKKYPNYLILKDPDFRLSEIDTLQQKIELVETDLKADADAAIKVYDIFDEKSFFNSYPVKLNEKSIFSRNFNELSKIIDIAKKDQLETFIKVYPPKTTLPIEIYDRVSRAYLDRLSVELMGTGLPPFAQSLSAIRKLKIAGFKNVEHEDTKIGFIDVTSKTLLKEGQIEFAPEIKKDISVSAIQSDLDSALTDEESPKKLIVFDTVLAKSSRRVLGIKKTASKILTGYREEPNPSYNVAQNNVANMRLNVQNAAMSQMSADSQWCQGLGCLGKAIGQIAAGVARGKANDKLKSAMEELNSTPMTLKHEVFKKYQYDRATIKAKKKLTVHYYVIDKSDKTYFKSTFDVEEKKSFEVAYKVHDDDPEKHLIINQNNTEKEVLEWEEAPATIRLTQLVDNYIEHAGETKPLPDLLSLRSIMLEDKNTALAKYNSENYGSRPLNDPRFDHVVVIHTPDGHLGSGFFIKPDIILTNWHVVRDKTFVEMKTYDGQETFGKVLSKDVRLDLALIKVQSRGKPVKIYSKRKLNLGNTVEAIGHPKGLEFSITRGVVSAVRHQPSMNSGGKDVLFIQTDAPINKGNSGGPLFLGETVIGINTQGYKKNISEGLNFAVHYSEIIKYLKDTLPDFKV